MDASFSDFLYWSGDSNLHSGPTSALSKYDRDVFWAYFAYFYMNKWADDWPVGITSLVSTVFCSFVGFYPVFSGCEIPNSVFGCLFYV